MRMLWIIGFCAAMALANTIVIVAVVHNACPAPAIEKPPLPPGPRQPTTGGERF